MKYFYLLFFISLTACQIEQQKGGDVSLFVLGNVQDAGSPQINCGKECCVDISPEQRIQRLVSSLGIWDKKSAATYLIDATPDIEAQMGYLNQFTGRTQEVKCNGVFLTHAHIGHYTGLMYFGRESSNTLEMPVYVMPRMQLFLKGNGPWDQLLSLRNIQLQELETDVSLTLSSNLSIVPILVPHRDEYSETVGFFIQGPSKTALYIPDIDKWQKWNRSIIDLVEQVDYALIDGTFYDQNELQNRSMDEIPHPFVVESLKLFESLDKKHKDKIYFIHLNHSNPLLNEHSKESQHVLHEGYHIARLGLELAL